MSERKQGSKTVTRREVMIQILSEVSGKPEELVAQVISCFVPESKEMDGELSKGEGEKLLESLRHEKSGILNWLIEGRRRALAGIHEDALRN